MAKNDFLPRPEGILDEWENNFLVKLVTIGPILGIDPAEQAELNTLVTDHRNAFANAIAKQAEARAAIESKLAAMTPAVIKIRNIAQKCRASSAYTNAYGAELGLIGIEKTLNLSEIKPEIMAISYQNDQIIFDWKKEHMDGIAIFGAKRTAESQIINLQNAATGTGGSDDPSGLIINPPTPPNLQWEEINRDYRSPYEDKRQNLGQEPEVRYYKFRYIYKDQLVGVDSDIIKVIAEIY